MKRTVLFIAAILFLLMLSVGTKAQPAFGGTTGITKNGRTLSFTKADEPKDEPKAASPIPIDGAFQQQIELQFLRVQNAQLKADLAKKDAELETTKLDKFILELRIILKVPLEYEIKRVGDSIQFVPPVKEKAEAKP